MGYRFLLLVCVVVVFAAPTPTLAQPAKLTPAALDNAVYRPRNAPIPFPPSVKLVNGGFTLPGPIVTGVSQMNYVFGDLNGDGVDDAVAVSLESLSGVASGQDIGVAAYLNDGGVPKFVDSVGVGHATNVESITIQNGVVTASGKYVGQNDPFCCPSQPFTLQMKVAGGHLVDLSGKCLSCPDAAAPAPSAPLAGSTEAPETASTPVSPPAPQPTSPEAPAPGDASGAPSDALPDAVRADVLAAVDRANAAWNDAGATLDGSGLADAVAGQALSDDRAELDTLRIAGQIRKSTNLAFNVVSVEVDAPGHAVVKTRETWSEEIDDAATGRVLQSPRSGSYNETYVVEFLNGGWIVTRNDL